MYNMVIIDDEEIVIEGLMSVVEWEKYDINIIGTATDGKKGLEVILKEKPDIVLTDIRMPGLDGLQIIKKAKDNLHDTIFVVISGHAEFEYAKKAIKLNVIDYLIKPVNINDILSVINKAIAKHKEKKQELLIGQKINKYEYELVDKYYLDLMLGVNVNPVEIKDELNAFKIICIGSYKAEFKLALQQKVINELKNDKLDDFTFCLYYAIDEKVFILIGDKNNDLDIHEITAKIESVVKENLSLQLRIGVGRIYNKKYEISQSYKEALKAFELAKFLNENIVFFDEVLEIEEKFSYSHFSEIKSLFNQNNLNNESIYKFIDKLLDSIKKQKISPNSFKKTCYDFVVQYENYLHYEYGISIDQVITGKDMIIENLVCIDDYHKYLQNMIEETEKYLNNKRISTKEKLIYDIKKYIDHNYHKPLQLSDIAVDFHLNASYLSSTFSKEVGVTISDYLLQLRISKAKELLRTTNLKIETIAKQLGYENPRYFHQVFKKHVCTTPNEYRAEHAIKLEHF
ncbi:response regulator [Gracilibacillus massiliensis]|uniref:response regulator n=1 Tax=Gracilibacillus massiliensis TaxID=1564956 RepID=UPI00071C1F7F|nr:response regulator [Gracilibacillus massiliensis]